MNTIEIVTGEMCGTAAFLGVAIGWPLMWLHYAGQGVLKLARPPQPKQVPPDAAAPALSAEPPAAGAAVPAGANGAAG